jgi:opacity protein-like surface antigen
MSPTLINKFSKKINTILFLIAGISAVASPAYSETYVGFGVGASVPENFRHVSLGGAASANYANLDANNSFALGLKVGHFWENFKLEGFEFGLELSYFKRDLDATARIVGSDFGAGETLGFRINSFQTLGLIPLVRKSFGKYEPYFGIGLAVSFLNTEEVILGKTTVSTVKTVHSISDIFDLGIIMSAGLNYKISERLKLYSEYKYSQSNFDVLLNRSPNTNFNIAFNTADHNFMMGLSYNFKGY